MPTRYTRRIMEHVADRRYEPVTVDQLAADLSVPSDQFDQFRDAVADLHQDGQVVLGNDDTIALPPPGKSMVGVFRGHERGFGFLVPDSPTEHGDLFIPPGDTSNAMSGDRVRARVIHQKGRGGGDRSPYVGRIVEILQRADKQYVGTLAQRGKTFVVEVDGKAFAGGNPVVIRDPHAKNARIGDKVVIDLTEYPDPDSNDWPEGVIIEVLGDAGEPEVETLAVMRAYSLAEKFDPEVMQAARDASRRFDDSQVPADREDLTDLFICTIDPPDAKDFDDAISIRRLDQGHGKDESRAASRSAPTAVWELGVHIADVSNFVEAGGIVDEQARERGNSTYLPRKVIPMLPELLSNGVCSLQEGVNRFTKSCFIQYDAKGKVVGERFSRSVIRSAKRLTYLEAQALIDGDLREAIKHAKTEPKYPKPLIPTLKMMDELAKTIRKRRLKDGMIVLGLPAVELEFDESGHVIDAHPEDDAFTHTIIEMFMVEANEAAARLFDRLDVPMLRRVHADPDAHDIGALRTFARVAGYNIPAKPSRKELQTLLDSVRGKPAQQAVHLAVLKTLSKAEYSPTLIGHFALASDHYTHFTSPIRRYADLVVHRGIDAHVKALTLKPKARKRAVAEAVPDEQTMHDIGKHCSNTEVNSEAAERELRNFLVLQLLSEHLGDDFEGTVTGTVSSGLFIQLDKYLVDGFVKVEDLPGPKSERWQFNRSTGALVAQRSGRTITIGHRFTVRIAEVDLARRKMELTIIEDPQAQTGKKKSGKKSQKNKQTKATSPRRQPKGARKAHQKTQQVKKQGKKNRKR